MIGLDAWIRRDADEQEEKSARPRGAPQQPRAGRSVSDGFFRIWYFALLVIFAF